MPPQRRAIENVLNPWPRPTTQYAHLDFAINLAIRFRWNVERCTDPLGPSANWSTRTIKTGRIDGDAALAVFVHEGGHLEARVPDAGSDLLVEDASGQRWRESLSGEVQAWRWAIFTIGRRYTQRMHNELERSIRSYWHLDGIIRTVADVEAVERLIADSQTAVREAQIVRL